MNVARWSTPLSRGRIRSTSNWRKIRFGGRFASLLKVTIESHSTEGCRNNSECVEKSINLQNTWFASIFLVYPLSDHSIILRKCTPGWRGCTIGCKGGLFFVPHLSGLSHLPGVPHLHVNRPLLELFMIFMQYSCFWFACFCNFTHSFLSHALYRTAIYHFYFAHHARGVAVRTAEI